MPSIGTNGIVEVQIQYLQTDVPRDYITNTYSVNTAASGVGSSAWQAVTDAFKGLYSSAAGTAVNYNGSKVTVLAYDRADPKPRPEKAVSIFTPGSWTTTFPGPRQICCRASMYAFRNLPRRRGGVYLAPQAGMGMLERISAANMTKFMQLPIQLNAAISALTPAWLLTIHSDVDDFDYPVDHYWVNDVWDTQRRREPKEATRQHSP